MNAQVRKPGRGSTIGNAIKEPQGDREGAQLGSAAETEARTADHQVHVALAAYFIAEKRGFDPGHELEDWLAAEAQVASAEQPSVTKLIQPVAAASMA